MDQSDTPPPVPAELRLDRSRQKLTVSYDDGQSFEMSSEFLRVHSPSAEVRGHGGSGTLQLDKQDVRITQIAPVGNYAVRLVFSDGHNTGLFTWKVLYELGSQRDTLWQKYLDRVAAHQSR
ncbi:MAG: DUF971 domain-containing protein [Gammaproteobacteria bacterium]